MNLFSLSVLTLVIIGFILYWSVSANKRWYVLGVISIVFYLYSGWKYIFSLVAVVLLTFYLAVWIEDPKCKNRKAFVVLGGVPVIGQLFFFKYLNEWFSLKLFAPIGISFFSLQALGYLMDVYRRKRNAEKNIFRYFTFISFFPLILSGPIERSDHLLKQLGEEIKFNCDQATLGLKRIAIGLFKKIVIADTLVKYVDKVYSSPYDYSGFSLVLTAFAFSIEIYCDFSGYSDIAIGIAKLFGIDLIENFKLPYFSSSLKEFWSKWHISLSSWFRDYVYIPLGGNRVGRIRKAGNILIVFTLSGLWHGANFTFLIWGFLHGLGQIVENEFVKIKKRETVIAGYVKTFLVFWFVTFAWIFFRANNIQEAFYIVGSMFVGLHQPASYILNGFRSLDIGKVEFCRYILVLALFVFADFGINRVQGLEKIKKINVVCRFGIYILIMEFIIMWYFVMGADTGSFIYSNF